MNCVLLAMKQYISIYGATRLRVAVYISTYADRDALIINEVLMAKRIGGALRIEWALKSGLLLLMNVHALETGKLIPS